MVAFLSRRESTSPSGESKTGKRDEKTQWVGLAMLGMLVAIASACGGGQNSSTREEETVSRSNAIVNGVPDATNA